MDPSSQQTIEGGRDLASLLLSHNYFSAPQRRSLSGISSLARGDTSRAVPNTLVSQAQLLDQTLQLPRAQGYGLLAPAQQNFGNVSTDIAAILPRNNQPIASFLHPSSLQILQQQQWVQSLIQANRRNVISHHMDQIQNQGMFALSLNQSASPVSFVPSSSTAGSASLPNATSIQATSATTTLTSDFLNSYSHDVRESRLSHVPMLLAQPGDELKLSPHQVFLRHQIEAFRAGEDEAATHTRGRNKPITKGQVGIRCRHCAHLHISRRQKGSTYYPASLQGIYQAAQNMSTTHMQCGLCSEMPDAIKKEFARLLATKNSTSGAGRPYWAESAKKLGLVDTEEGIRFLQDIEPEQRSHSSQR